jgi:hypothetical protein
MAMLAGYLAAVAIEDDERRGATPAAAARLAECVRRQVGGVEGRGRHRARLPRTDERVPLPPTATPVSAGSSRARYPRTAGCPKVSAKWIRRMMR